MRKLFFSALALLTLFSCREDKPGSPLGDGESRIVFSTKTSYEIENISTRANHTYLIKLEGAENREFILESETVAVTPGEYTITATTPVSYSHPNVNVPVYQDVTTVTVPVDDAVQATLTCVQINAGVRFVFDQSVKNYFKGEDGLTVTIADNSDAEKSLPFTYADEDENILYFEPADLKITLTDAGGSRVPIGAQESAIITVEKQQLWTITLKTSQTQPGRVVFDIKVETETDPKEDELGIGDVNGEGTFESPYSVGDAINVMPAEGVWVQGYIVGQSAVTRTASSALLIGAKSNAVESECLAMEFATTPDFINNLLTSGSAIGKTVKLKGDVAGSSSAFVSDARAVITNITDFNFEGHDISVNGTDPITISGKTLKEVNEESIFRMGATVKTDQLFKAGGAPQTYFDLINRDFNSITLEYEMKMSLQVRLNNKQQDYRKAWLNQLKPFAQDNQLSVHGHALVWYKDVPGSAADVASNGVAPETWEDLSADDVKRKLEEYIEYTMLEYSYVRSWDVVNEAFNNSDGGYWDCLWKTVYGSGENYVREVFKIARNVVKKHNLPCKLFYNDYKTEYYDHKRTAITTLIKKLNSEHAAANGGEVLIDGVGLQMHLYIDEANAYDLEAAIDKAVETGCLVHISELSVAIAQTEASAPAVVTDEMLKKQTQLFNEVFDLAFNKVPEDKLWGITFWGLNDTYSPYTMRQAMLFDADFNAKRSYFEIINKYSK